MRKSFNIYARKLATSYGIIVLIVSALGISFIATHTKGTVDLLAAAISSLNGASTTIYFRSYGDTTIHEGGTTSVDVNVNAKIPVNALGVTISFPKDTIEIVGISKEKSFLNLWTEDTSISEDTGEIHFSGGTTKQGGIMGTGTLITLTVRAKAQGTAELRFTNIQVYPSDGSGDPLNTETHSISYTIDEQITQPGVISAGGASISTPATAPTTDLNGDGKVNLIDVSIFIIKMLGHYDSRYDFNLNGSVGLDDLSIMMSKI